jgi:hypothetical protein
LDFARILSLSAPGARARQREEEPVGTLYVGISSVGTEAVDQLFSVDVRALRLPVRVEES